MTKDQRSELYNLVAVLKAENIRSRKLLKAIIDRWDNALRQDEYFGVSMDDEESIDEARKFLRFEKSI